MRIYLIIALYQGNCDGVVFSSTDEEKADQEYRKLVREALRLYAGRTYIGYSWIDVEARYEDILENEPYPKIEAFYRDFVEVE